MCLVPNAWINACAILLAAPLTYLYIADFDILAIKTQLLPHATEHDAHALQGNLFYAHFIGRFIGTYKSQLYLLPITWFLLVAAIRKIYYKWQLNTDNLLAYSIVFTNVYWFFTLAPFDRYTICLQALYFLFAVQLLAENKNFIQKLKVSKPILNYGFLLFFMAYGALFWMRNIVVIYQWPERDYKQVMTWLHTQLPIDKKVLLVDYNIGHFYANTYPNTDYSLPYSIYKFRFANYDKVYQITPVANNYGILVNEYIPATTNKPKWVSYLEMKTDVQTYKGYKLYLLPDSASMAKVQKGEYE